MKRIITGGRAEPERKTGKWRRIGDVGALSLLLLLSENTEMHSLPVRPFLSLLITFSFLLLLKFSSSSSSSSSLIFFSSLTYLGQLSSLERYTIPAVTAAETETYPTEGFRLTRTSTVVTKDGVRG